MWWWVGGFQTITYSQPVHPLIEYDLNGKNYDQKMTTILDPKLRLKYDWYVNIKKINMTNHIHAKN